MSIRNYTSEVDALDEVTLQMLGSRLRKVALDEGRYERPRHRRERGESDKTREHKSHRPRVRHTYE